MVREGSFGVKILVTSMFAVNTWENWSSGATSLNVDLVLLVVVGLSAQNADETQFF